MRKSSSSVAIAATRAIVLPESRIPARCGNMGVPANPRAERVRQILSTRGLSLYQVSRLSAEIFGASSSSYIPHNLYSDLATSSAVPSMRQLLALSQITNYRITDWLSVFGFDLDALPALQLHISRDRTVVLDSTVYDTEAWIPWFREKSGTAPVPPIAPLGQVLARAAPVQAKKLLGIAGTKFLYAKVGREDSLAFPELVPGSIVRIDPRRSKEALSSGKDCSDKRIFLVEHESGFACSRLSSPGSGRVLLRSPQLAFSQLEFALEKELRILGVIDAEIRFLRDPHGISAQFDPRIPRTRPRLPPVDEEMSLKQLIRRSHSRSGLSFREASQISRFISDRLSDPLYFTAASTLSDFETLSTLPRHVQKIMTLCVLYSIPFWAFLHAGGVLLERAGRDPIPDELMLRDVPGVNRELPPPNEQKIPEPRTGGFLERLLARWQEIPAFLRNSLGELAGIPNFSVSDLFWVGGEADPIHPWLRNADLVAINRRVRKPVAAGESNPWGEPMYLLLGREGRYLCASCTLDDGFVVVHPYPDRPFSPRRFRNGTDAEIVGQVTAILRRLV